VCVDVLVLAAALAALALAPDRLVGSVRTGASAERPGPSDGG
jgi:hypothetical protein